VAVAYHPFSDPWSAFIPTNPVTLVAMITRPSMSEDYTLRVFAMGDDGGLEPLDEVTGRGRVGDILFHPSGRFLYLVRTSPNSPASLTVFAIDLQGHLEEIETLENAGGMMAASLPDPDAGLTQR
jgi:6-phosphogluconolactonase (cycloisomerase 2 family)